MMYQLTDQLIGSLRVRLCVRRGWLMLRMCDECTLANLLSHRWLLCLFASHTTAATSSNAPHHTPSATT
jgi:hypothetical protein